MYSIKLYIEKRGATMPLYDEGPRKTQRKDMVIAAHAIRENHYASLFLMLKIS